MESYEGVLLADRGLGAFYVQCDKLKTVTAKSNARGVPDGDCSRAGSRRRRGSAAGEQCPSVKT